MIIYWYFLATIWVFVIIHKAWHYSHKMLCTICMSSWCCFFVHFYVEISTEWPFLECFQRNRLRPLLLCCRSHNKTSQHKIEVRNDLSAVTLELSLLPTFQDACFADFLSRSALWNIRNKMSESKPSVLWNLPCIWCFKISKKKKAK